MKISRKVWDNADVLQHFWLHNNEAFVQLEAHIKIIDHSQFRWRVSQRSSRAFCESDQITVNSIDPILAQVTFSWWLKVHVNWRQLIQQSSIEFCHFMTATDQNPFFRGFLNEFYRDFPEIPKKCPIKPGCYYAHNVSFDDRIQKESNMSNKFAATTVELPNGVYRMRITMSTNDDPQAVFLQWSYEIKKRMNDGNL